MRLRIGHTFAPPRFVAFALILLAGAAASCPTFGWRRGIMASFDCAAMIFLASLWPLLRRAHPDDMRDRARRNDANRGALLAVTVAVMLTILVSVGSELVAKQASKPPGAILLIVGTLVLAWVFANTIYALHYTHLYYSEGDDGDAGGITFPGTPEPGYWDFIYFSFTLGMTFQTSDTDMTATGIRKVAIFQCLAAFVFNLGVLALTINVLGS